MQQRFILIFHNLFIYWWFDQDYRYEIVRNTYIYVHISNRDNFTRPKDRYIHATAFVLTNVVACQCYRTVRRADWTLHRDRAAFSRQRRISRAIESVSGIRRFTAPFDIRNLTRVLWFNSGEKFRESPFHYLSHIHRTCGRVTLNFSD